jgi:hypothetical protein
VCPHGKSREPNTGFPLEHVPACKKGGGNFAAQGAGWGLLFDGQARNRLQTLNFLQPNGKDSKGRVRQNPRRQASRRPQASRRIMRARAGRDFA